MVEIPDLGDEHHRMWAEVIRLAVAPPAPWVLIGAQMVDLHGWSKGREPVRPSKDADILVNARALASGVARLSEALHARGFELDGVSPEWIGHRLVKDGVSIDVLAPDGLGPRADLRTLGTARTVQVPGGTQALQRMTTMDVRTRDHEASVPVPNLLGAILIKARAIEVDDHPEAQRRDTAFLLTLVDDPDPLSTELKPTERGWLRRHGYFGDPSSPPYAGLERAEDGAIVFRRLTETG